MNGENLTVYPASIESDDDLDIPEFRTDNEESICIKIDTIDDAEPKKRPTILSTSSLSRPKSSNFGSIITAIRIAKWMAKAYGFASQKKSLYAPQDTVNRLG